MIEEEHIQHKRVRLQVAGGDDSMKVINFEAMSEEIGFDCHFDH